MNKNELIGRLYRARKDVEDAKTTVRKSYVEAQSRVSQSHASTTFAELVYIELANQEADLDCAFDRLTEILDSLCTMEE